VRPAAAAIGFVGGIDETEESAEIGYWLGQLCWDGRHGREAILTILNYGFEYWR